MSTSEMLQERSRTENFPVALRMLPARTRADLLTVYRFARYVDQVGDAGTATPGERVSALYEIAEDIHRLYDGRTPGTQVVADLAPVVNEHTIPIRPWTRLVDANLQDQRVTRYATFDQLLGYCALSANPVGEVVLHIFDQADPTRVALSDRVCTGLQLIEHWQDVGEDFRSGRVYLPAEDLRAFGVEEVDLGAAQATGPLRDLIAFEVDRALAYLGAGAVLVGTLRGWARLAVSGYVSGGRAAATVLERHGYDPLGGVPTPTSMQVAREWLSGLVRRAG